MARRARLLPLLLALLSTGCLNLTSPEPVDRELVLAPSQRVGVPGTGLSIQFDGVIGDSRCPADALCVWGGDAIVRIVVTRDASSEYDLHTGDMKPVRHAEFTIELVKLEPYPFSGRTIDPADYRATLRVTRGE